MSQPSFESLLQLRQVAPKRFAAHFPSALCFGTRAHGGTLVTLVQKATALYQPSLPDTLDLKIHFVRVIKTGEVHFEFTDVSTVKQAYIAEVRAFQRDELCFVGLLNIGDLPSIKGVSFDTRWSLHPPPLAASISQLAHNLDPHWLSLHTPWHPASYRRPHSFITWHIPTELRDPSYWDAWLTLADPSAAFTTEHLGYVGDLTLPILDNFLGEQGSGSHAALMAIALEQKHEQEQQQPEDQGAGMSPAATKPPTSVGIEKASFSTPITYVTLSYNMEVKKRLSSRGARWLFTRSRARRIAGGRMDNEVYILDDEGDLVAIMQLVHMIIKLEKAVARGSTKI